MSDYQIYERKPLPDAAFKRCGYFSYNSHRKLHFVKRGSIISLQPDFEILQLHKNTIAYI